MCVLLVYELSFLISFYLRSIETRDTRSRHKSHDSCLLSKSNFLSGSGNPANSKSTIDRLFEIANRKENLDAFGRSIHIDPEGRIKILHRTLDVQNIKQPIIKDNSPVNNINKDLQSTQQEQNPNSAHLQTPPLINQAQPQTQLLMNQTHLQAQLLMSQSQPQTQSLVKDESDDSKNISLPEKRTKSAIEETKVVGPQSNLEDGASISGKQSTTKTTKVLLILYVTDYELEKSPRDEPWINA